MIDWKMNKNDSCGTSITDIEIRSLFLEAKQCQKLRVFLQQIGVFILTPAKTSTAGEHLLSKPTIIFEGNKGVADCIYAKLGNIQSVTC